MSFSNVVKVISSEDQVLLSKVIMHVADVVIDESIAAADLPQRCLGYNPYFTCYIHVTHGHCMIVRCLHMRECYWKVANGYTPEHDNLQLSRSEPSTVQIDNVHFCRST